MLKYSIRTNFKYQSGYVLKLNITLFSEKTKKAKVFSLIILKICMFYCLVEIAVLLFL